MLIVKNLHENPYQYYADDGTRTRNFSYKTSTLAIELNSTIASAGKDSLYNRGVASSSPIISILTVNFSTGTKSSCVQ